MKFRRNQINEEVNPKEIAHGIFNGLKTEYEKNKNQFILDKRNKNSGLLSDCAGVSTVLVLGNTFDIDLSDFTEQIIETINKILNYVNERGYDYTPLILLEEHTDFYDQKFDGELYFTESVAWVLTAMLHFRRSISTDKIVPSPELRIKVNDSIVKCLRLIVESATEVQLSDKSVIKAGWGALKGCTKPDLYFSASIMETLADFADFVLGEYSSIDYEFKAFIESNDENKDLLKELGRIRKNVGIWLFDHYKDDIDDAIITIDKDNGDSNIINNMYIVEMLIFSNADIITNDFCEPIKDGEVIILKENNDKGMEYFLGINNAEEKSEVQQKIEHAIYFIRKIYDTKIWDKDIAKMAAKPTTKDKTRFDYKLHFDNHKLSEKIEQVVDGKLSDKSLKPLFVRINMLFAYYINRFPDRRIIEVYNSLVTGGTRTDLGLFGNGSTSELLFTAKVADSVIDYVDYKEAFGGEEDPLDDDDKGKRGTLEESVEKYIQERIDKKINDEILIKKMEVIYEEKIAKLTKSMNANNNSTGYEYEEQMNNMIFTLSEALKYALDKENISENAQSLDLHNKLLHFILEPYFNNGSNNKEKLDILINGYAKGLNAFNKLMIDTKVIEQSEDFFKTMYNIGTKGF